MIFMQEEMQNDFKKDLKEGKIFGLKLVKEQNITICSNVYGLIYGVVREITGFDEEKFYLKTKKLKPYYHPGSYDGKNYILPDYGKPDGYVECEAYFGAFSYYDGNILRASVDIPAAVDPKNAVQITEYQVIRSY